MNDKEVVGADVITVEIDRLGAQGDGVAAHPSGSDLFVPYALPGERVSVKAEAARGRLVEILSASPDRATPPCRHFGSCGGCMLQHVAPAPYADWKRALVIDAFAQRGLAPTVAALESAGPGSRRRAVFGAVRTRAGVLLGFHGARDSSVINIEMCPVLNKEIVAELPGLRLLLAELPPWRDEARVTVVRTDNGVDVAIADAAGLPQLDAEASARVAATASRIPSLMRLSIDSNPVYQRAVPEITMGRARVDPPAGVFLQASAEAERLMAEAVLAALPKRCKRVGDLFSGVGAFTFPLAARAAVTAIDSDRRALTALEQAARKADGLKPITTLHRDLFREPLSRKELENFDLVVFDPPRAGAKAQAEMLAKSKVPVVVAVSCNPATLARDARTLVDGGYQIGTVTPVDQFVWSAHVEAVAVFRRQ